MSKPHLGRPPKSAKDAVSSVIVLRVRRERKAAYVKTAQARGLTLSAWMLQQCDRASR